MKAQIRDIDVGLPERILSNEDLDKAHPDWNIQLAAQRSGVHARHVAGAEETALDLGYRACRLLMQRNPEMAEQIDVLIFCTQSADYIMPPNACVLHQRLQLPNHVMAFDLNMACSGFVYAMSLAHSMIRSGTARNVLLVNADTYSKFIHPGDRSARVLFGDGAAATWVAADESGRGVCDVCCETDGKLYDKFIIPAGGCRTPKSSITAQELTDDSGNVRTQEHIQMAGRDILAFVASQIPKHVTGFLRRNELTVNDIDLFVFHQASGMVLDTLTRLLRLDAGKVFRNLENLGNTVSASIPIALRDAIKSEGLSRGDKVLMCGFGVGLSWGSVLLDY